MFIKSGFVKDWHIIILILIIHAIFWEGIHSFDGSDDKIWSGTRSFKPELGIVPDVPSQSMVKALSLGDTEFLFRVSAFNIQNAGDSFGRSTSLQKYDYKKLYGWWTLLDKMNSISDFVPTLVSYYFSASQNRMRDVPYAVKYLDEHFDRNPHTKWWWAAQAAYLSSQKLKDNDTALEIANKIHNLPVDIKIPFWGRQLPAFILEDEGEYNAACEIIAHVFKTAKDIPPNEINFMIHFINERVDAVVHAQEKGEKIQLSPECQSLIKFWKDKNNDFE